MFVTVGAPPVPMSPGVTSFPGLKMIAGKFVNCVNGGSVSFPSVSTTDGKFAVGVNDKCGQQ
jgi:hypothetical protein